MAQDSAPQSLIPYLDSTEHPFALKITFPVRTPDFREDGADPFITLNDTAPLTRLVMGRVITNTGYALKDLYLLLQRDAYQVSKASPDPFNNTDIERSWQEAARLFADPERGGFSFAFQPAEGKGILPFRSLFYCALKDLFFHPPCPSCGGLLELCTVDDMLETAGLSPYSSSLQRSLYCPSCVDAGNMPRFFAPRKEDSDPPVLADLHDLIRGFGQVLGNTQASFPCSLCPENAACYGSEEKAATRILPFSFFPFYLMAFDSYPVDAMEYLKAPSPKTMSAPEVVEEPRKEAHVQPDTRPEEPEEDSAAVIDILLALRKKWEANLVKAEKAPEQEIKELPVDMLEKTMIFSPAEMEMTPPPAQRPTEKEAPPPIPESPQAPPGEVVLEKTIIFSPGTTPATPSPTEKPPGKAPPAAPKPQRQPSGEILEKTMIRSPDREKHDAPEQAKKTNKTEAIPETVIMSLDDLKGKK
ncbi:MAG: hypothetical protein JRI80_02360 [Deltaproteobacteria bacterium]|nr:hypothetical protein [Deltaproteobacteria bacterium]